MENPIQKANDVGSISSFRTHENFNQARLEARRQTRKRITIISLSVILLVVVVVAAVAWTSASSKGKSKLNNSTKDPLSIKAVCKVTQYPDSCLNSLAPLVNSTRIDPLQLFQFSLKVALDEISTAFNHLGGVGIDNVIENKSKAALSDCKELLELSMDHVNGSLTSGDLASVDDLMTWLSAAGTYIETCIDGFENAARELQPQISNLLKYSKEFTSNSLAIIASFFDGVNSIKLRRLMSHPTSEFPVWLSPKDRKLLANSKNSDPREIADIVVAKDGSGRFKKIQKALEAVPDKGKNRFVIYVKKGIYKENVRVEKTKWNVMMVGDGMDSTIVTGRKNRVDGTQTFSTATFAAFGKGFIAQDMCFRNTAGPVKQQAVALMSNSDQSVFYRCRFDAFQDTLYAHSLRQFYRECDVLGTVDFIFGNAAAVLQNCTIRPRVPMLGQRNTITAQGRDDPQHNTGISIHNCVISAKGNLSSVRTYLGRPWKPYSTTVFMQSMLGSLIDPAGWLPWDGKPVPDTIFYSEFQNYGPGSSTKNRVKWKGLRTIGSKQADEFTVKSFLGGDEWVSESGVIYKSGL